MLCILLGEQYDVETAATMEEATKLASEQEFDLYLLDKRLPDGTGLQLCESLTTLNPEVPCIFYSGDAYAIHRSQAFEAGASAYIPKPDIDQLITTVQSILSERECAT
jgi:two-component system response regulator PilR (NtrC family)